MSPLAAIMQKLSLNPKQKSESDTAPRLKLRPLRGLMPFLKPYIRTMSLALVALLIAAGGNTGDAGHGAP